MKLLFSGASNYLVPQTDLNKSLGGFMSNTPIPNKKLNALFSDISDYDLREKSQYVLGIFLNNDSNVNLINISLQAIYQSELGEYINLCDFEFSISEISSNGSMELIGSNFEEPFYVDWFECESRYEDCTVKLKNFGETGDDFSIFGLVGVLSGNGFNDLSEDISNLINSSEDLKCIKVDEKTLYVVSKKIGITNLNTEFVTSGNAELESDVSLQNGKVGETIIHENLLAGDSIGIWIKRKINNNYKNTECVDLKKSNLEKVESLELIFDHE